MLNLENTIEPKEIAELLGISPGSVRQRVVEGQIAGLIGGSKERQSFIIPRTAFYKKMGWITDEEIRHAYKMAGMVLKEKVVAGTTTQN